MLTNTKRITHQNLSGLVNVTYIHGQRWQKNLLIKKEEYKRLHSDLTHLALPNEIRREENENEEASTKYSLLDNWQYYSLVIYHGCDNKN